MLFGSFGTLAGVTEIWTITAIALERYRTISTPLTKVRRLSSCQIHLIITFIWTLGIFVSILPLMGINRYVAETYLLVCEFDTWSDELGDRIYIYLMLLLAWLFPIIMICHCYLKVRIYCRKFSVPLLII